MPADLMPADLMDDSLTLRGAGTLFLLFTAIVFAIDLTCGGATHADAISSALCRLAGIPLLCGGLWRLRRRRLTSVEWTGLGLLAAIGAIPVIQLVPLPPALWTTLPGRGLVVGDTLAVGTSALWRPMSLTPYDTADVLLWLIPPGAMFVAALGLTPAERRVIVLAVPLFAVVAVLLGLLQVLDGPESQLRPYAVTNPDSAVGFFANRNHQAALLVVGVTLAPLWLTAFRTAGQAARRVTAVLTLALIVVLLVGLAVTRSRAGVLLAIPALAGGVVATVSQGGGRTTRRAALGILLSALVSAVLVYLFALPALLSRFQLPISADQRLMAAPAVRHAVEVFFPAGSGLGSFNVVYRVFEPLTAISSIYFNHAHNDWLEVILEGGAPALVVLIGFIAWWIWASVAAWRNVPSRGAAPASASVVIALLTVHSLVDYPLRTESMACIFALACAILVASASRRLPTMAVRGRQERDDKGSRSVLASV